jgi:hypothetical protein
MVRQATWAPLAVVAAGWLLAACGPHVRPTGPSPFAPICPVGTVLSPDTLGVTVYVLPTTAPGRGLQASPEAAVAAEAIAEVFRPPRTMALAHPIGWVEVGSTTGSPRAFPLLDATLLLHRPRPAAPVEAWFKTRTGSAVLNDALLAAASAADSLGTLTSILPGSGADTLHILIGGAAVPPEASARLFHIQLRYFPLDDPVRATLQPTPHHPAPGFDDAVDLRYVVDAHGQPLPGTIEVLRAHYQEMAAEATRVIAGSKFKPAHRRGCAVPQLVFQRVGFHTRP